MKTDCFKVGDIITMTRPGNGGVANRYYPVRLLNVALVGMETKPVGASFPGCPEETTFHLEFLQEGRAEIQFAKFRTFDLSDMIYEEVLPFEIAPKKEENDDCENALGGWGPMEPLTEEDVKIFNEAMAGLKGATYIPECVSKQVVAGINYRFICLATSITLPPVHYQALVEISFNATSPKAELTRITRIH